MKTKRTETASRGLEAFFSSAMIVSSLFKINVWVFFRFDTLTRNVYITLFGKYTIASGCGVANEYQKNK